MINPNMHGTYCCVKKIRGFSDGRKKVDYPTVNMEEMEIVDVADKQGRRSKFLDCRNLRCPTTEVCMVKDGE